MRDFQKPGLFADAVRSCNVMIGLTQVFCSCLT